MAGYIGSKASVVSSGAERKKTFAITGTTTVLTGVSYTPTFVHLFHNGVRLVDGTDYTATNGTSITLTSAAESGDEVVVISYASFQVADAYTKAEADAGFVSDPNGAVTVDGSGNVVINSGKELRLNRPDGAIYGSISHGASGTGIVYNDANGDGHHFQLGGSERMRIDDAGRVTTPSQPFGYAIGNYNGVQAVPNGAKVDWLSVTELNGGMAFSNAGRFTVPVSGVYYVTFSLYSYISDLESKHVSVPLYKNGAFYAPHQWEMEGGSHAGRRDHSLNASFLVNCSANDYLEIQMTTDVSQTVDFYKGTSHNFFSLYLLG